jgi:prepilin signal peptidase PulO-like enzyme (type II secretory pathway)
MHLSLAARFVGHSSRLGLPKCAQPIRFYDNLPILSWLLLRGRCRRCKATISPRYLVVELLTGALFLACYAYFGFTLATLKVLHVRIPARGPDLH